MPPPIPTVTVTDPDILGGAPVFAGTRAPLRALLDYLEAGDSINDFLEDFPSVTRQQAEGARRLVGAPGMAIQVE